MQIDLTIGELITSLSAIVAIAWALLKITIGQFEKRHDAKFGAIDTLLLDVKKLEIEQLRRDNQYSEKFATKQDLESSNNHYEKTTERIFNLLNVINDKIDTKLNKSEYDLDLLKSSCPLLLHRDK